MHQDWPNYSQKLELRRQMGFETHKKFKKWLIFNIFDRIWCFYNLLPSWKSSRQLIVGRSPRPPRFIRCLTGVRIPESGLRIVRRCFGYWDMGRAAILMSKMAGWQKFHQYVRQCVNVYMFFFSSFFMKKKINWKTKIFLYFFHKTIRNYNNIFIFLSARSVHRKKH